MFSHRLRAKFRQEFRHLGDDARWPPRQNQGLKVEMVGAARFELATSCTPSKRASQATLRPDRFRISQEKREIKRRRISASPVGNSTNISERTLCRHPQGLPILLSRW